MVRAVIGPITRAVAGMIEHEETFMHKIIFAAVAAIAAFPVLADRYGVDESLAEGSGNLSDMVLGALLVGAVCWLWKKFFG